MAYVKPIPTAPPSTYGLKSYLPMSSQTNQMASNFKSPTSSNSGQLNASGSSWYASAPKNIPTTPYQQPKPQPGPAPQVLGSNNFNNSVSLTQDQGNQGLDLIEQEYNNAIGTLSSQEGALRGQADTAGQQIESEAGQVRTQLSKEQGTAEQGIATQQQTAERSGASAMQQARDLFRQTQQNNIAQLSGAGLSSSSVAEALAERLGVETSRRIAGITGSIDEVRQNAAKELARTKDYYASKLTDIQNQVQVQKSNIQNSLVQGLNQINSAKNQAAADKARSRFELISNVQNTINQLVQQQQAFEQSLKQWATQKSAALTPIVTDPNFLNTLSSAQTEFAKNPQLSQFNIAPSFSTDAYGAVNSPIKWTTSLKKDTLEEDL